jgi:outer membrane receptor protein involved in Fe transport
VALTERATLTAGLRAERRTTDYVDTAGLTASPSESMLGGELSLRYTFRDGLTGYTSLSSGYRAGGFNLGVVPDGRREFDQERLWNLEAGLRLDAGRVSLDAAVFYNRRDDQQVRTSFQIDPNDPASFVFFTENAAEGDALGIELETRIALSAELSAYVNFGLLDADFTEYDSPLVDLDGRAQAHAPSYTAAAGIAWRPSSGWFASLDASAVDAFYFDVSHDQRSEAYELVHARVGYERNGWTATLWARNLFDETYAVRGFFFGNEPPDFPPTLYTRLGDPRLIGLTIKKVF